MTASARLHDAGTALERTALAWTRTGLALLATTALAVRLLVAEATWLVCGVAAVGVGTALLTLRAGRRRYADVQDALEAAGPAPAATAVRTARSTLRAAAAAVVVLSVLLVLPVLTG